MADDGVEKNTGEDEPLEEVDAVGCEVTAPGCEVTAVEREGQAHESEAAFFEEIHETFAPKTTAMVIDPSDGMPVPADEGDPNSLAVAHPFTYDNQICIEDDRAYVELFAEELVNRDGWRRGKPHARPVDVHETRRLNLDVRSMYDDEGRIQARRQFLRDNVEERFGHMFVIAAEADLWLPVRPIRERCRYYKRQNMANDDAPTPGDFGHHIVFRNCTMRRSVGGAFMTLRDEAVYACDYRSPPEPASVHKYLDERDRQKLISPASLIRPFNLG